jgi:hypothetical protein
VNDVNIILLTDYLFFLIFVIFLALIIGLSVKGIVWLIVKLGVVNV